MARLCPPGKFRRALDLVELDLQGGIQELEALARTYAKDPDVRAALGTAYLDDERPFEALPHLEWAERKDPTPHVQDALLATYLALDMPQHARRLAARSQHLSRESRPGDAAWPEMDAAEGRSLPTADQLVYERARIGLLQGDPKAAPAMERLLAKHPDYQPARNLLVTHELIRGNIGRFGELAEDAFARAPGDPHALLNAARAAFLQGGVEGARGLRPHADALAPEPGWGGDRYLARAEALALMDDADATEAAVGAYRHWAQGSDDDAESEVADALDALLERRRDDPRAPIVDLAELIVGLLVRWEGRDLEGIQRDVAGSLAGMPGLLHELPASIGYQSPGILRLLSAALLLPGAPPPPDGSWATVFERVARHGPGTREGRRAMLLVLAETGHIADGEAIALDADDDGGNLLLRRFEISGEPVPSGLPAEEEARMVAALDDLARGRVASALGALGALHERHPDSVPLTYNLALAERHSGGDAARRGHERMQRLVERHPDYLFARVDLALAAIDAGDLEGAESLLALPEGKHRFHAHEWGVYVVASGRLALAHGDVGAAEGFLDDIGDTLGRDAPAYRALAAALDDHDGEDDDDDGDDDVGLPEALDLDELAALPVLDERWCIALRPAMFMIGEDPEPTLAWVGAVATDDGLVRVAHVEAEPFDEDSLYALFAMACEGGNGRRRARSAAPGDHGVRIRRTRTWRTASPSAWRRWASTCSLGTSSRP
jgi:predicted Zn-dependent protease